MRKLITFFIALLVTTSAFAQGANVPLNEPTYHILDRLEIKTGLPTPFHSGLKGYTRGEVAAYALAIDTLSSVSLSFRDRMDLYYLFKDNNEWLGTSKHLTTLGGKRGEDDQSAPTQVEVSQKNSRYTQSARPIFNYFYRTPANLLEVNDRHFHLRLNPVIQFDFGRDVEEERSIFTNRRGLRLRGGVDDRVFFFAQILETQARFPRYINQRIEAERTIPGAALYKNYESSIFDIQDGYDFLIGEGYLNANLTRHLGLRFGYGRHFIGNGYRSLLLSDYATNQFFLQLNWRVWKIHYQNTFSELKLIPPNKTGNNQLTPNKYQATHHLSLQLLDNLNVGLFETVLFSRNEQFELQYLNPLILYRTIEQAIGSPDNVLLGLDVKWNLRNRVQLYGQLVLDEFKFKELFVERRGWWANKWGLQGGLKWIDVFGVDHLDLQAEVNVVRPYTYSHRDSLANYTHADQPLAHPRGANFAEFLLRARYQPSARWLFEGRLIRTRTGLDELNTNWGTNILLPNLTREQTYNNEIGQGIKTNIMLIGLDMSYQWRHNLFVDVFGVYRDENRAIGNNVLQSSSVGVGLRWNIARQRMDF